MARQPKNVDDDLPPGFAPDGEFKAYDPGEAIPEVEIIMPDGSVTTPSRLPDDDSNIDEEEDLDDISDLDDEGDDD